MSRLVYMCAKVALEMPRVPFTSRTDQKTDELRQLFGLSETENLVEEFMCAMQRKILHQGHMYLFDKHVCFYSNIFGYEKKKCIPLTDVTAVRKAKTALIVPNAIEIMAGGKRNFFASFLSRDEAYRLIVCSWKNCSGYARLYLGSNIDNDGSTTPPDASSGSFTDMGSLKNLDDAGEEVAVADVPVAPPETCATASLVASPFAAMSAFFTRATTGLTASAPSTPKLVGASGPSMSTSGMAKTSMGPLAQSSGAAAVIPGSVDVTADGDADPIPPIVLPGVAPEPPVPETADQVVPEEGPAPPVADTMKLLLEEVMEGLSAAEFVANFYSDPKGAEFQRAYHRNRGDEDVIISEWKPHTHFGLAREISMRSPVKASFGPKSTRCHLMQKLKLYEKGMHVVFQSSQVLADIPFGDFFRIETRWDVREVQGVHRPEPTCLITIHIEIPFSKRTMFRGKIEQGATDESRLSYQGWFAQARALLRRNSETLAGAASTEAVALKPLVDNADIASKIPPEYADQIRDMLKLEHGQRGNKAGAPAQAASTGGARRRLLEHLNTACSQGSARLQQMGLWPEEPLKFCIAALLMLLLVVGYYVAGYMRGRSSSQTCMAPPAAFHELGESGHMTLLPLPPGASQLAALQHSIDRVEERLARTVKMVDAVMSKLQTLHEDVGALAEQAVKGFRGLGESCQHQEEIIEAAGHREGT
eukprot:jgi/Mesvir1/10480/Mv21719-RA.2